MKGFRFFIFILASLAAASCIQDPLVERNEPEAPEFSYSNATRTSVTLIGRPNNPQPDSRYGFVVYVFAGDEKRQQANSGDIDQLALDNTFTYKLTDLKPGTTYYVRSFISNGSSRKLSDELPISTPSTSKATVSDVTLTSDGRLSARVIDDGGREVEEVGFVMSDTPTLRGQREMIPAQRSGNEMSIPLSYFSTGKYFIYAYADNYSEKGDKDTGYSSVPYELEVKDDDFVDISDPEFKRYLISNFDLNSDGNLSYGEMKLITSIDLITDDIVSIDEISLMPDLVSLVCCGSAPGSGGLITLDVSRNSKLIRLDCGGNRLESLDVSSNSLLETLICSGNRFDVLVTSRVHLLDSLDCSGNKIHSVDLSGNSGLRFLDISGNPVEEIDLAPCLALKDFRADGCALRELDLSTNRHLESVRCLMNPLESFKIYAGMNPEGFVLPEGLDIDSMIDGFWIVDETVSLKIGDSVPLSVVFSPEDTYDKAVSWRSDDETVAHVSEEGEVFGLSEGSTIVYAVSHGITDSCEVNVSAIPVESVVLNHTSLSLKVGSEVSLSATILPDNATHREVAWSSSDPSVASVSSDGEVKAVAEGTCSITAVSGSVSAECEVTVPSNVNPVTSVTLNQAHLSLIVGDESDLSVVVSPEDATDKTVVWSSSDPSVATANAEGIVVAVAPGTCRIIATCGAASSGCDVVVRSSVIPVASVFLNTTSLSLVEGNNAFLTASISPEDATDKTVSWSSSDPSVATVNAEGSVVAVAPGTCKITVSCGDVNASCNVDVESEGIPVSGVSFSETTKEVYIDEIFTIKSTISPSDATNKSLAWQSSDPSIANVASDGTVTPVGKGVATITATAPSGISASFTCDVVSEAPYFPDEVFRTYVFSKFDSNKDGFLSRSEAKNVTSIGLYGQKISSLEGIASFDHLTKLSCTANRITSLDLSSNKLLEVLYCGQNALEKLNISENYYLRILACNLNHLNNLDVSNNILLEELDCSANNQLAELDLSSNLKLVRLYCGGTSLTSLDLKDNIDLVYLNCYSSKLSYLDVSQCTRLNTLICDTNQLTSLNVSFNKELQKLDCSCNPLNNLDISANSKLTELSCAYNELADLNVSSNSLLTKLTCYFNQISDLDIRGNAFLTFIDCSNNKLSSLDLSNCGQLNYLNCNSNQLSDLNISNSPNLVTLYCLGNKIQSIEVSSNTLLQTIRCSFNQFSNLDLSNCKQLVSLECESANITNLNVSGCQKLSSLYCPKNKLELLNVNGLSELSSLYCDSNSLTLLTVEGCEHLTTLYCPNNFLKNLDLSSNLELSKVVCTSNTDLTDIWLSQGQTIQSFSYPDTVTIHYK